MRFQILTALTMAMALSCVATTRAADDVDAWSRSKIWQVRYGAVGECLTPSAEARAILERLATDENTSVARHAFSIYSRLFVDLDKALAHRAIDRGELDLVGSDADFRSGGFWCDKLQKEQDPANKARAIRALGLIGDVSVLPKLPDASASKNPYFLAELAVALRRLGKDDTYLATLEALLNLPVAENIYYQTFAVDCLIQTHPDRSRSAWERLDKEVARLPDLQPNWVFAHYRQQKRLPQ